MRDTWKSGGVGADEEEEGMKGTLSHICILFQIKLSVQHCWVSYHNNNKKKNVHPVRQGECWAMIGCGSDQQKQ